MDVGFTNLLIIVAVGFAAPLALGFAPAIRLPSVVVEIVAGIVVGPAVLGWVSVDEPVRVFATVGLAYLLFLAGLEVDFDRLRGRILRVALIGFAVSLAIAIAVGLLLKAGGFVSQPLFVAIVLSATSLGVLVPVLEDAGEIESTLGQLIVASATIADFATVILLSLVFSREAGSTASRAILLGGWSPSSSPWRSPASSTRAASATSCDACRTPPRRFRIRGAFVLLIGLVALATELGVEVILSAFIAGAMVSLVDRDRAMTGGSYPNVNA
jgi:Kef-type K+ transport system membrane component KefB